MNDSPIPEPYFHADSDTVRFWVPVNGELMGSSINRQVLHFHFRPNAKDDVPLETYTQHAVEIASAVERRVAQGSREPVMLREFDLRKPSQVTSAR